MATIEPLWDNVLVKRDPEDTHYSELFEIPEEYRKRKQTGIVVAKGPGNWDAKGKWRKPECNVGDRIFFPKYVGFYVDLDGVRHTMMHSYEMYGVLETAEQIKQKELEAVA